ncbi:hypothetical protein Tco_0622839 [Tanacetum coccineum]
MRAWLTRHTVLMLRRPETGTDSESTYVSFAGPNHEHTDMKNSSLSLSSTIHDPSHQTVTSTSSSGWLSSLDFSSPKQSSQVHDSPITRKLNLSPSLPSDQSSSSPLQLRVARLEQRLCRKRIERGSSAKADMDMSSFQNVKAFPQEPTCLLQFQMG